MTKEIYLSIFTAVLASILSVFGFYITSSIQAKNEKIQKQFELKTSAYLTFLNSISKTQSPIIAQILSVGESVKHVATDAEIQNLENNFERLAKLNEENQISWQLDSDFNVLRLCGSEKVRNYCEDMMVVLANRHENVDWTKYPKELQAFRKEWLKNQEGKPYGYELKVSDDERIIFILLTAQYRNLINQLHSEIQE